MLLDNSHMQIEEHRRPNIVFILADDVNRNTWGAYGSKDCQTPHIDRLASGGVRFDRAYGTVAMCAPFRQELYTGRSPWRTGTLPNHATSKPDTTSIAHYLKPLGYRVSLIGKSHIGPRSCYPFEYFGDGGGKTDQNPLYIQTAQNLMDECTKQNQPFCMFIASHDGHDPYTTGDVSAYDADKLTIPPYWLDTPELRKELVKYYAEITNFDKLVGQVRAELEQRGLWENTIFMVCSEQGTSFPFAKWTCYDNGLHTGLIAHWAGVTRAGHTAKDLVSIADVTPTLVEAAGGTLAPGDCDGRSFLKLLKGESDPIHDYVFGAFSNCNIMGNHDRIYPIRVIRDHSYTLIYNPNHRQLTSNICIDGALAMLSDPANTGTGVAESWVRLARQDPSAAPMVHKLHHRPEYELYKLDDDPYELNNLIDSPAHADIAGKLKTRLHARLAELGDSDPIQTETGLVAR
jgi:uncharacterized sulfatase